MADDILDLQRAFDDVELNGDAERLGELLADDFQSIGEQGYQLGKREWIGRQGEFRRLSHVWVWQSGRWQLAGIQFSRLGAQG